MSDTPRTNKIDAMWEKSDSAVDAFNDATSLCRELERELAAENNQIGLLISGAKKDERTIKYLQERIKRLIEAGDTMESICRLWTFPNGDFLFDGDLEAVNKWTKAKALP